MTLFNPNLSYLVCFYQHWMSGQFGEVSWRGKRSRSPRREGMGGLVLGGCIPSGGGRGVKGACEKNMVGGGGQGGGGGVRTGGGYLVGTDSEEGELGEEGGAAGLGGGGQVSHVEAEVHLLPMQVYVCMEPLYTHTYIHTQTHTHTYTHTHTHT